MTNHPSFVTHGTRAKITGNAQSGHGFEEDTVVEAYKFDRDGDPHWRSVEDHDVAWYVHPNDLAYLDTEDKVERPTIDFGGDSRATAREYAESLLTSNLKPDSYAVLKDASLGYVVDAYALNEAVLDGMRQSATRYSQSSQRREHAKRAAYLGHITQAVLENHADQLPVYEPGERSRAVQSWKEIATSHQQRIQDLEDEGAERVRLLDEASDALRQAKHEVDLGTQYRELADAEVTRLLLKLEETNRRAELAEAERDAAAATISYTVEALDPEWQQRVIGYWDGVKDATLPVNDAS